MLKQQVELLEKSIDSPLNEEEGMEIGIGEIKNIEMLIKESDDMISKDFNGLELEELVDIYKKMSTNISNISKFMENEKMEIIEHE